MTKRDVRGRSVTGVSTLKNIGTPGAISPSQALVFDSSVCRALSEPRSDSLFDFVLALKVQITAEVMTQVRVEMDATEPVGGLMKVSRAAVWLECHPDHVYRLIHDGELIGYPFPDERPHLSGRAKEGSDQEGLDQNVQSHVLVTAESAERDEACGTLPTLSRRMGAARLTGRESELPRIKRWPAA